MKMPKILMSMFFFAVLLAGFAAADAQITYQFFDTSNQPVDGVTVQIYLCKDASCSSVEKLAQGTSADSGAANDFEVTYPKALMSQYGYAIYFFKDSYLPIEGTADWHGTGSTTLQKYFQKGSKCHAAISEFSVANKVEKNIPMVVSIAAQADANTYSAFGAAGIPPLYHPPEFKDLYSAATDVKFNVYDANNNQVIAEQSKSLNLFMDTAEHVSFEWTPAAAGFYKVVAKTTITDSQCDSTKYDEFAQKQTEVLADRPASMCYTLLNNLSVSKKYPVVGDNVDISVAKISNFADGSGVLSPVATNAKITVTNSSGYKVVEMTWDAASASANSNAVDAKIIAATWTPGSAGIYTITITASGSDAKCSGANKQETISQSITVKTKESEKSNVFFTIADMDIPNVFVSNAVISMAGKTATTDASGKAGMTAMDAGTYTYTTKNKYYYDSTGTVIVGATDVHKAFTMMPKRYTLTVKVVDQNGNAIENARVTANSPGIFYNSQDTNANGNAVFSKIHAGQFYVVAIKGIGTGTDKSSGTQSVDLDSDKQITLTINLATDQTATPSLDITSLTCINPIELGKVQSCSVSVRDNSNSPVALTTVKLYHASNDELIGIANTGTNGGDMDFNFGVNAVGTFTVYATAEKAGYISDNDKNPTYTYTVTEATPGQSTLVITSISGTNPIEKGKVQVLTVNVKDNLNKPVNAVDVRLYYSSNNGVIGNVNTASTTDIDGNIKLAFGVDAVGDYTVYATAGKAGYTPDNDKNPTYTYTVTEATPGQNLLPYFDPALTNKNVVLGNTLAFTVSAKDNEKDAIVYSVSDLPSGASFDANTGKFSWTPVYVQLGTHKVKFKITDAVHMATGDWFGQEITITVSEPERISQKEALDMQRIDVTNEDVVAGGQFITTMTIANDELVDLDHVRIYVSIPELGVWNSIGPFQLESGEESTQTVIVDIPKNAKPGKYYIRYDVKDSKAKAQLTRDFIRIVK